jgi:hypothetical protein
MTYQYYQKEFCPYFIHVSGRWKTYRKEMRHVNKGRAGGLDDNMNNNFIHIYKALEEETSSISCATTGWGRVQCL